MKEITSPLKHPLHGYRGPAKRREVKPKKLRQDPLTHDLLNYFRGALNTELDGTFSANYDSCEELIARCRKQGSDPEQVLKTLIDVATHDPWYGPRSTSCRYLLNNAVAIFRSHRAKFIKLTTDPIQEALHRADERFAREQGGGGPDTHKST